MNVTSFLSQGYLHPIRPNLFAQPRSDVSSLSVASGNSLASLERDVLAQEQNLKLTAGPSTQVSTVYHYTIGPDGRRYISGASVTLRGNEEDIGRVAGGIKGQDNTKIKTDASEASSAKRSPSSKIDPKKEAVIRELQQTEHEVIAHEAAHQAAAGRFGGPVRYTRTTGPDGKSYITGGEVPISIPASNDPEETLRNMERVQQAALAPGNPSGQDIQVAAKAASQANQARRNLMAEKTDLLEKEAAPKNRNSKDLLKTGIVSIQASLRFDTLTNDFALRRPFFALPSPARILDAYTQNKKDNFLLSFNAAFAPIL